MPNPSLQLSITLCVVAALVAPADADPDPPGEVIEIQGTTPSVGDLGDLTSDDGVAPEAARALTEPGFVSRFRLDRRAGEATDLAALLAESVGAVVRSLAGPGSFAALSVRGAAPGQTQVVIDGVPLSRLGSATIDLGRVELASVAEVALYRAGAPGHLGGAAGSALHLTSEVGPSLAGRPLRLRAMTGSFGARQLGARWLGGDDRVGLVVGASYAGSRGDFGYFDDRGTNLESGDDRSAVRDNAGHDAIDGVARYRRRGRVELAGGVRTTWRAGGVPGPAHAQSHDASLATTSVALDQAVRGRAGALGLGATAYALVEQARYRDRRAEVGIGAQDRRYRTTAVGATVAVDRPLGRQQHGRGALEARVERYAEADLFGGAPRGAAGHRVGAAVELGDALGGSGPTTIELGARLEWARTRPPPDFDAGTGMSDPASRDDAIVAPRVAARVALGPDGALKAGVARTLRLPTALELFGDRGTVVGNPALRAERGWTADLGGLWAPGHGVGALDRIYLEAALFYGRTADTIALVPSAALVVVPRNLGGAHAAGAELSAAARLGRSLSMVGHYTAMVTRQVDTRPSYDGKELPHRPRHRLHGRAELARRAGGRLWVGWTALDLTAGNHLDPANLDQVPRRTLVGGGLKVELEPGLLVGVELDNLLDERVESVALEPPPRPDLTRVPRAIADFYGYPLPGRALYLTLQWEP